jgi:hypothetical protein
MQAETGEMGLPFTEKGSIIQACCAQLVMRGHDHDAVLAALRECNEQMWWDTHGGQLLDDLEKLLELEES